MIGGETLYQFGCELELAIQKDMLPRDEDVVEDDQRLLARKLSVAASMSPSMARVSHDWRP